MKDYPVECCNDDCDWAGMASQCVRFKHDTGDIFCPECWEKVEPVTGMRMTKFEQTAKKIAMLFGMEDQEDDVAYVLLELVVKRRLNWRKMLREKDNEKRQSV